MVCCLSFADGVSSVVRVRLPAKASRSGLKCEHYSQRDSKRAFASEIASMMFFKSASHLVC